MTFKLQKKDPGSPFAQQREQLPTARKRPITGPGSPLALPGPGHPGAADTSTSRKASRLRSPRRSSQRSRPRRSNAAIPSPSTRWRRDRYWPTPRPGVHAGPPRDPGRCSDPRRIDQSHLAYRVVRGEARILVPGTSKNLRSFLKISPVPGDADLGPRHPGPRRAAVRRKRLPRLAAPRERLSSG